jgi:hypothetical protein
MSAYIGNAPGVGQDQLYVYFPAALATTLSGADSRGINLAYTVGEPFVEVQVNGRIIAPSDYTATTGNTIVLAGGNSFNAGDVVVVRARSALSLANTYTQSAADALLVLKADIPGAWTTYSPGVSSTVGSLSAATSSARYKKVGSLCFFDMVLGITNNGTGSGAIQVNPLPFAAVSSTIIPARENGVSGAFLQCLVPGGSAVMSIWKYDNTYPVATGASVVLGGVYEITP